jgi:MarR-like DNA-binding transcriptional regulator SgrR of sgrS sRNA
MSVQALKHRILQRSSIAIPQFHVAGKAPARNKLTAIASPRYTRTSTVREMRQSWPQEISSPSRMEVTMSGNVKNLGRRELLQKTALATAAMAFSPFALRRPVFSQARSRVTVAHGVGIYSLNPYAVNTSPLQAIWQSIMEPLIDVDYDQRRYQGVLAESWQMNGNRIEFKLRKGIRFHDGTPFTSKDVIASFRRTKKASWHPTCETFARWMLPMTSASPLHLKNPMPMHWKILTTGSS